MPAENPSTVIKVLAVLRNGHNNPDGTPVRGVKLLTGQGVREIWEDHRDEAFGVDMYIKAFNRGRERLTNKRG